MANINMIRSDRLNSFYKVFILLSVLSCLYSLLKPGISPPTYPSGRILQALTSGTGPKLSSTKKLSLNINTPDRKISEVFKYSFADDSVLQALMVRVRKEGDFKIEGYGLLTKNIVPIYLENPVFTNSTPYSMKGRLNKALNYQTCIVPGSLEIEHADVRLSPLLSTLRSLSEDKTGKSSIVSKLFGLEKPPNYTCLVLTYYPSPVQSKSSSSIRWSSIVKEIQSSLSQ